MLETSGWFNSISADVRNYDASMFDMLVRYIVSDGILYGDPHLRVTPGSNVLSLKISPGNAYIRGKLYSLSDDNAASEPYLVISAQPAISQPYIGRVVLHMEDFQEVGSRYVRVEFRKGAESNNPVPPELRREADNSVWELGLAEVTIYPTTSIIDAAQIKDTRFIRDLCGIADFGPHPNMESALAQGFTQSYMLKNAELPVGNWKPVDSSQFPDHEYQYVQFIPPLNQPPDENIYSDASGWCGLVARQANAGYAGPVWAEAIPGRVAIFYLVTPSIPLFVDIFLLRGGQRIE